MRERFTAIVLLFFAIQGTCVTVFSAPQQLVAAPSRAELDRAIALAAGYLDDACSPEGEFAYQVDTLSAEESQGSSRYTRWIIRGSG